MANKINSTVPSLSQMATVVVLENNNIFKTVKDVFASILSYIQSIPQNNEKENQALFNQWNSIKHEFVPQMHYYDVAEVEAETPSVSQPEWAVEPYGIVATIMQDIEIEILKVKPNGVDPFQFLQANVMTLFRELKKALPVPLTDLAKMQFKEDQALQKIYAYLVTQYNFPALNTVEEIKAFLNDPANQSLILSVNQISYQVGDLEAIPPQIGKFTNLQNLDLSRNQISFIPIWLNQLQNLQSLIISMNQIKTIPAALESCKKLEYLDLSHNQIEQMPDWMGSPKFTRIDLSHNKIRAIPQSISNISQNCRLFLNDNQIIDIPNWVKYNIILNDNPGYIIYFFRNLLSGQ
jgi:Leucine Rich Repeat (LRR) protein